MTLYDAIKLNRELIIRLFAAGMKAGDWRHVDLYEEYTALRAGGEKATWVVAALAERHRLSERQVWHIVRRMGTECKNGAA